MQMQETKTVTAFIGTELVKSGSPNAVTIALRAALQAKPELLPLVFDDDSGKPIELDLRGPSAEVARPHTDHVGPAPAAPETQAKASRGRPRLGVIAREVTLLPEHWEWLASQPGGASVALRKLVHEARRENAELDERRRSRERAYNAMVVLAGNLPGFEEASRALFAGELDRMAELTLAWPPDIRSYLQHLAAPGSLQAGNDGQR